jgi:hypothetical protein
MGGGPYYAHQAVMAANATLPVEELADAFMAACRTQSAQEVFDTFSPYLIKTDEKKKKGDPATAKRQAIAELLERDLRWMRNMRDEDGDKLMKSLDPRWLDLVVQQKDLELVLSLARPNHAAANKLLAEAFDERLKKSKDAYEFGQLIVTMVRIQHPGATDAVIAAISKHAKGNQGYYGLYWIGPQIPHLPKEALPKLEALLPTLPEKAIDQVLDYVTQLKNRP